MANYNDITEMWSKATRKLVAPAGFKGECENYIFGTMVAQFKTDKFIIPDDLYCTGITSIEIEGTSRGKSLCWIHYNNVAGEQVDREDLDDETMYNITRTIYEFESKYNFDFVQISEQDGVAVPFRKIKGFRIEPILKEGEVDEYVDINGTYHCNMPSFYMHSDSAMLKLISYRFNNIKDLFYRYLESRGTFIAKKPSVDENALRTISYHYIFRALENSVGYELTRPCGDMLFEVNIVPENDETGFEDATLEFVRADAQDNLIFGYSNGREECLEEIDISSLWGIVYSIEYKSHIHFEDIAKAAQEIGVTTPTHFATQVKDYLRHILIDVLQSSRFGHFCGQRLMIMDKGNTPMGYLYDVICKNNVITLEYLADDDTDINFMCDDTSSKVYLQNFDELSPISMYHIARYIGYVAGDDEGEIPDYSFIYNTENWDDLVGVRVPYRKIEGELVTIESTFKDSEMTEIAKLAEIEYYMSDILFYTLTKVGLDACSKMPK